MSRPLEIPLRTLVIGQPPEIVPFIVQPIVGSKHGRIFGFEVLYRGEHPATQGGWNAIDLSMLRFLAVHPVSFALFVNLSNETIMTIDEEVLFAVHHENNVFFEWSEAVSDDRTFKVVIEKINAWTKRGLRFVIDDFGAGRDGFERLFAVEHVAAIKIDRLLLQTLARNPMAHKIIGHVVKECARKDILTVGEGIETAEEWRMSEGLGMDLLQGWHIDERYAQTPNNVRYG